MRKLLSIGLLTLLGAFSPVFASTSDYPTKSIRLVVPYTPGGGADLIARMLGKILSSSLKQNVVIDNRPGGNTIIGTELVARSLPDGYTLLVQSNNLTALPAFTPDKKPVVSVNDLAPVSLSNVLPLVLVVHRGVPASSVQELVASAKASPNKLSYGSSGVGSAAHLASAWFNSMAGIEIVHVPFKGAAGHITSLLGGEIQIVFTGVPNAIAHIRNGALKGLGVTTTKRVQSLPQVPTIAESGYPAYEMVSWYGVLAPAKTPPVIVTLLSQEIARAVKTKEFSDRFSDYQVVGNAPHEFAEFLRKDAAISAKMISQSGAKSD